MDNDHRFAGAAGNFLIKKVFLSVEPDKADTIGVYLKLSRAVQLVFPPDDNPVAEALAFPESGSAKAAFYTTEILL